jgi:glycosyltransferase involved in cell wall biosynthesis
MATISAVLIVKNEEALLPRCLESLKGLDSIVIVDTGSTDKTIEIAKQYTDQVYTDFTWCDNFAAARNHAKSKCKSDWILSVDADEILHDVGAVKEAVAIAESRKDLAVDVKLIAENQDQWFLFPRLFKNCEQVWWEGAVHNTLSIVGSSIGNVTITVGFSPAHKNDPDRAFRILKKEAAARPTPRILYYLGREYSYRNEYENCVVTLGKYVQVSNFLAEKADAFLVMSQAYWNMKMPNDARDACVQALIINANFKEAILFMARLAGDGAGNERWQKNADQWKRMAMTADNSDVLFIRKT